MMMMMMMMMIPIIIIIIIIMFLDSDGTHFVSLVCKYNNQDLTLKITTYINRLSSPPPPTRNVSLRNRVAMFAVHHGSVNITVHS
jgi:hypothetical protein